MATNKRNNKPITIRRILIYIIKTVLYSAAFFIFTIGFVALFMSKFGFRLPFVSETLVPFLQDYTIEVAVWDSTSTSEVVTAQHLVFFLCLVISLIIILITNLITNLLKKKVIRKRKVKISSGQKQFEEKIEKAPEINSSHEDTEKNSSSNSPENSKTSKTPGATTEINSNKTNQSIAHAPNKILGSQPLKSASPNQLETSNKNASNTINNQSESQQSKSSSKDNLKTVIEEDNNSDKLGIKTPSQNISTSNSSLEVLVEEKFGTPEKPLKTIEELTKSLSKNK